MLGSQPSRQTDTCENITLPQTLFAGGKGKAIDFTSPRMSSGQASRPYETVSIGTISSPSEAVKIGIIRQKRRLEGLVSPCLVSGDGSFLKSGRGGGEECLYTNASWVMVMWGTPPREQVDT